MGLNASGNVVRELKQSAKAALTNEYVTRQRVDRQEKAVESQGRLVDALWDIRMRTLRGRLRWLLLGR